MAKPIRYIFDNLVFMDSNPQSEVVQYIQRRIEEHGRQGHLYLGYLKYYDVLRIHGNEVGQLICFRLIFSEEESDAQET